MTRKAGVRAMFGIGNRVHPHRESLEPPYAVDVVADLHAGVYPDDVAKLLKPRVLADPDANAIWMALEATTAQLAGLPDSSLPVPPFAQERIDQALTTLARGDRDAGPGQGQVTRLSRHRGTVALSLAAAAAVVGIAVAATFAFTAETGDSDREPVAMETSPIATLPTATLLSVLGSTENTGFTDRAARDRCLLANQIPASTQVLGSGSIDNTGNGAVVILLATGTMGTFDALVVATDCTTGNPATISRTTIGDK